MTEILNIIIPLIEIKAKSDIPDKTSTSKVHDYGITLYLIRLIKYILLIEIWYHNMVLHCLLSNIGLIDQWNVTLNKVGLLIIMIL